MPFSSSTVARIGRALGAAALVATSFVAIGCPSGKCWMRLQEVDNAGNVKSDKCLVDTCPKKSSWNDTKSACECEANLVTLGGACHTNAEANASCGKGYAYANGGCIARTCAAGQVLNAETGACDNKSESDAAVAANAGVSIKTGETVGCPAGQTYVINGREGACVPNELTCGSGTKFENGTCVATACPAGTVYDAASGQCTKLATGGDNTSFSVQLKLNSEMSASFCAPHAKNPAGFHIPPGGAMTIKVSVSITVPGNNIEQTALAAMKVTNTGGAELTPEMFPEVANINKHVNTGVIGDIRALGGRSVEAQASAEVTCTIKRAPIVIETKGGGV